MFTPHSSSKSGRQCSIANTALSSSRHWRKATYIDNMLPSVSEDRAIRVNIHTLGICCRQGLWLARWNWHRAGDHFGDCIVSEGLHFGEAQTIQLGVFHGSNSPGKWKGQEINQFHFEVCWECSRDEANSRAWAEISARFIILMGREPDDLRHLRIPQQ